MTENQRLKIFRLSLDIPQGKFAESIGLQQGSYSGIERGKTAITLSVLKKIVDIYHLNASWLITGNGDMILKENIGNASKNNIDSVIAKLDDALNDAGAIVDSKVSVSDGINKSMWRSLLEDSIDLAKKFLAFCYQDLQKKKIDKDDLDFEFLEQTIKEIETIELPELRKSIYNKEKPWDKAMSEAAYYTLYKLERSIVGALALYLKYKVKNT